MVVSIATLPRSPSCCSAGCVLVRGLKRGMEKMCAKKNRKLVDAKNAKTPLRFIGFSVSVCPRGRRSPHAQGVIPWVSFLAMLPPRRRAGRVALQARRGSLPLAVAVVVVLLAALSQGTPARAFVVRPPRTSSLRQGRGHDGGRLVKATRQRRHRGGRFFAGNRLRDSGGGGGGGEAARRRGSAPAAGGYGGTSSSSRRSNAVALSMGGGGSDDNRSVEEEWPFHKSRWVLVLMLMVLMGRAVAQRGPCCFSFNGSCAPLWCPALQPSAAKWRVLRV